MSTPKKKNENSLVLDDTRETLSALLRSVDRRIDKVLRERLRQHVLAASEAGMSMHLSDPKSPLGSLMALCNRRSRDTGWL
jgi:hypothetical protein